MTASHAFLARTRVPDTIPGPRKVIRAERVPGSVSLEELERRQRTYKVEFKPDLHPGSDLHWQVRRYGPGHWCRCDGQPHWLRSEAEAHAAGKRWIETGRTKL